MRLEFFLTGLLQGTFKFKRECISKKFIHNTMEKFYTLLLIVVHADLSALVPTLWKLLNSSFKEGFQWLLYPTLHTCNDITIILASLAS
jgi:hypothetical protein